MIINYIMKKNNFFFLGESVALLHGSRLTFGWAKGRPADKAFPSSHQADCWFCLASPSVKVTVKNIRCLHSFFEFLLLLQLLLYSLRF